MDGTLEWLAGLPPAVLYLVLAVVAAIENIFPPVPADTVVAFGSFLAARGEATMLGAFLSTWVGNTVGAMAMYWAGRRWGAERLERRLDKGGRSQRLASLYGRYGTAALFFSRFLPGIRALVPPFAGAAKVPALRAFLVIGAASALWYGLVTWLAYHAGSDWDALQRSVGRWSGWLIAVAAVVVAIGVAIWFVRRRRRTAA